MNVPICEILEVVRDARDVGGLQSLRDIATRHLKRPWKRVQAPDMEADIQMATSWFQKTISISRPTGVYFRLNSAEVREERPENVEMGITIGAATVPNGAIRTDQFQFAGESHLIWGLEQIQKSYLRFELSYDAEVFANCVFFFGYAGMVLASGIERLSPNWDCLFTWGFCDGDACNLARTSPTGIERLAEVDGDWRNFRWGYTVSD